MAPRLLALIKWCGGNDDKKYTTGVPVNWIKEFNYDDFKAGKIETTETYVIEWRDTKKEPSGGWKVYDGYVIEVSDKAKVLENKLLAIDGLQSPTKIVAEANIPEKRDDVIQNASDEESPGGSRSRSPSGSRSELLEYESRTVENVTQKTKSRKVPMNKESQDSDTPSSENESVSGCARHTSKKAKARLFDNRNADDAYKDALSKIFKEIKRMRKSTINNYSSDSSEEEEIELGPAGSGIKISSDQWDAAKRAPTYTAMGINLLMALFPMETLLKSNLRGRKSTITKDNTSKNTGLNPRILEVLFSTVRRRWKGSFSKTGLGIALNNKLTRLRAAEKEKMQ